MYWKNYNNFENLETRMLATYLIDIQNAHPFGGELSYEDAIKHILDIEKILKLSKETQNVLEEDIKAKAKTSH